jgi:cytochrome c-type biogenesis protein CcmH
MVGRLAARLARDPHDADGWMRLMRARQVLGDPAGARAAYATARARFAGDAASLGRLKQAAEALGVGDPSRNGERDRRP